jgi:hypothetical protein
MRDPPLDLVIKNVCVVRPRRPQVERLDLGVQGGRLSAFLRQAPFRLANAALRDGDCHQRSSSVVEVHPNCVGNIV